MPIYLDWQDELQFLGFARLLEFIKEELSFITEEENENIVICGGERWLVEFTKSDFYPVGFQKRFSIRKELYRGDKSKVSDFTTYDSKEDLVEEDFWEDDLFNNTEDTII